MKKTQGQPILGKIDHAIIMNYLKSSQARTLFNRYDAEELLNEIGKACIVNDQQLPEDVVRLNSKVKIRDEAQKVIELTVVTPKMANIKERKISVMSPMGIALIGYRKGQRVTWKVPLGEKQFTVLDVRYEPVFEAEKRESGA